MSLAPLEHAALIVIDVQAGLFGSEPPPHDGAGVVGRINGLAARARRAGAPVVFIQHQSAADAMLPGTPEWRLQPGLEAQPDDLVLPKATCDAFYGTSLEARLRQLHIRTLVLAGYATDFCVDSTLRAAVARDYAVVVAADAHTTHTGPVLGAEQVIRHLNWAWAECTAAQPVRVAPAAEIDFRKS